MSNSQVNKVPLDLNEYAKFEIPQEYSAFTIKFEKINEKEAEDLEFEYIQKGYKIFNSSLEHSIEGLYRLELIIAKLEMLF